MTSNLVFVISVYGKKRIDVKEGIVFAMEFSYRRVRDFTDIANRRNNMIIILIVEDTRHFYKYMLIGMMESRNRLPTPKTVFAAEVKKQEADNLKPQKQTIIDSYDRNHCCEWCLKDAKKGCLKLFI